MNILFYVASCYSVKKLNDASKVERMIQICDVLMKQLCRCHARLTDLNEDYVLSLHSDNRRERKEFESFYWKQQEIIFLQLTIILNTQRTERFRKAA